MEGYTLEHAVEIAYKRGILFKIIEKLAQEHTVTENA
jgi:hypothetical protein